MARKSRRRGEAVVGDPTDPRGMAVLREKYLDHMLVTNFSPNTIVVRRLYLNLFIKWCQERSVVRPSEVTKPIVDRYQRWMYHYRSKSNKPLSFHSQHGRLQAVKAWFRWLTRENHILSNPAADVDLPRVDRKLPRHILSASEADQIINGTDLSNPIGLRDRAILETLYSTGLRRAEMANLNIFDVDLDRATVLVRKGKFRKDRIVPIGQRALLWLNKYLIDARPQLARPREDALFVTNLGELFTPSSLTQLARHYVEKAKLPSGKMGSCHLFRHTMATLMLEGGADVRYIQAMLGHADLSTTQIYTHVGIRVLQQVHALTHPTGLLKRQGSHVAAADAPAGGAPGSANMPDVLVENATPNKPLHPPPPPPLADDPPLDARALDDILNDDEDDTGGVEGVAAAAHNGGADDG